MVAKRNFKMEEYFSVYLACVYSNMISFPFFANLSLEYKEWKNMIVKQKYGKKFRAKWISQVT